MGISKWGVQNRQLTPKERWLSFGTILLVATLAALNMFKASPAIQYIASDMEMPQSMVSQIMEMCIRDSFCTLEALKK